MKQYAGIYLLQNFAINKHLHTVASLKRQKEDFKNGNKPPYLSERQQSVFFFSACPVG